MSHPIQSDIHNRILAALPGPEFALLSSHLTHVHHDLGESLHRAGDVISNVYFVDSGFISALTMLSDGQPLEIGLIGAEGVVGVSVILGAKHAYSETMCQTGGDAYRITVAALLDVVKHAPMLRDLLLRYTHVFHVQVAQTAACNAHHDLGQRLARWLLAAHDRSGVPELSLTQDLIAVMLGVRRSTVSIAASTLQRAGVIRYQHGRITILDRVGLENGVRVLRGGRQRVPGFIRGVSVGSQTCQRARAVSARRHETVHFPAPVSFAGDFASRVGCRTDFLRTARFCSVGLMGRKANGNDPTSDNRFCGRFCRSTTPDGR